MQGIGRRAAFLSLFTGGAALAGAAVVTGHIPDFLAAPSSPKQFPTLFLDGWELLLLDSDRGQLIAFDPRAERVVGRLDLNGHPTGLLHLSGALTAVTADVVTRRLTVLSRARELKIRTYQLDLTPVFVAMSPDAETLAVLDWELGDLLLLSAQTGDTIGRWDGFDSPHGLLFDPSGRFVLAPRADRPEIDRIDLRSGHRLAPIRVAGHEGISLLIPLNASGIGLALPHVGEGQILTLLDLANGHILRRLAQQTPVASAVSTGRGSGFLTLGAWEPVIQRFETDPGSPKIHQAKNGLFDMPALGPDRHSFFTVNTQTNEIVELHASSLTPISRYTVPETPSAFTAHSWSAKMFAALPETGALLSIDPNAAGEAKYRHISLGPLTPHNIARNDGSGFCHV